MRLSDKMIVQTLMDSAVTRWLAENNGVPLRDHPRLARKIVSVLGLHHSHTKAIEDRLDKLAPCLEFVDGILQVSPGLERALLKDPVRDKARRPCTVAARVEPDEEPSLRVIYKGPHNPKKGRRRLDAYSEGLTVPAPLCDEWRQKLAGMWLDMVPPEVAMQAMFPEFPCGQPLVEHYGLEEDLALLEEACVGLVPAAPACA